VIGSISRLALVAAALVCLGVALAPPSAQDAVQRRGFVVEIKQPANQEVVFGKTKIAAKVKIDDAKLVDRVEFIVGDDTIFVDREPPYECQHDFGEGAQSFIVRAVAHHVEGVEVSDAVITRRLKFATIERVNRVILWVSASDKDGNFISDLSKEDFKIYEDGVEQKVLDFYHETRPISMAILLYTSGSMQDKIIDVHKAAGAFVESLRDIDQALVIDFDDNVFLIQELTSDHDALVEAITSTEPLGATSLYDAVHAAYRKIGQIEGRKVVVLLSDGEDTSSQFGFKRVLEEAKMNNTMIYGIGLGGGYGGGPRKNVLNEFADATGGRAFFVKKPEELARTYQQIAEELGKQYFLSYSTTNENWDGHWIKIKVDSERSNIKVRARSGYFAVRSSGIGS
jgi:VWFA-related protein